MDIVRYILFRGSSFIDEHWKVGKKQSFYNRASIEMIDYVLKDRVAGPCFINEVIMTKNNEKKYHCIDKHINFDDDCHAVYVFACADIDTLKYVINKGVYLNEPDSKGNTLVMKTVKTGYINNLKLIVSAGADLESEDMCGETAIHHAVSRANNNYTADSIPILQFLIDSGAKLDHKDNRGKTAIDKMTDKLKSSLNLGN